MGSCRSSPSCRGSGRAPLRNVAVTCGAQQVIVVGCVLRVGPAGHSSISTAYTSVSVASTIFEHHKRLHELLQRLRRLQQLRIAAAATLVVCVVDAVGCLNDRRVVENRCEALLLLLLEVVHHRARHGVVGVGEKG